MMRGLGGADWYEMLEEDLLFAAQAPSTRRGFRAIRASIQPRSRWQKDRPVRCSSHSALGWRQRYSTP